MSASDNDRLRRRRTFGEDAELYDRYRPNYPAQLCDDLNELASLSVHSRILEIGCGTGQITVPLATQGYSITTVELSPEMASVARQRLSPYPSASVEVSAFEDWALPSEKFDLVLAATSFHWLDPAIRMHKTADALRTGGLLAVVSTRHIAGGTAAFFDEVQECYEQFDPATKPGFKLPTSGDIADDSHEFVASGHFDKVVFRRYEWEVTYSADEYVNLLLTYSDRRTMATTARTALLSCIENKISRNYGGNITKRYMTQLAAAYHAR